MDRPNSTRTVYIGIALALIALWVISVAIKANKLEPYQEPIYEIN